MEMTYPFAVVGKTGLLAFKICEDEVNAEGGLLGRPRQCDTPASWISLRNTRRGRLPKGSPCSAISCRRLRIANCRSSATRLPRRRLSTTTSLPNTCTRTHSTRSRATSALGPDGEWTEARPIWVQYHGIKGHDVEQFRGPATVAILAPAQYKTGEMIYPYTDARK